MSNHETPKILSLDILFSLIVEKYYKNMCRFNDLKFVYIFYDIEKKPVKISKPKINIIKPYWMLKERQIL